MYTTCLFRNRPLGVNEERWEAIEQAERQYRDTRLRVATEHIGLAQLPEGLELVRIGRPARLPIRYCFPLGSTTPCNG